MAGPTDVVAPSWSNYYEQGVVDGDFAYAPRAEILTGNRFLLLWIEQQSGGSPAHLNLYARVHDSATLQPLSAAQRILMPGSTAVGTTVTYPNVQGVTNRRDFQTLRLPFATGAASERVVVQFSSYAQIDGATRRFCSHLIMLTVSAANVIAHADDVTHSRTVALSVPAPTIHLVGNAGGTTRQVGDQFWVFHCWATAADSTAYRYDGAATTLILQNAQGALPSMADVVGITINEAKGTILSHTPGSQATFAPSVSGDAITNLEQGKSWPSSRQPREDGGRVLPNGDEFIYPFHEGAPVAFADEPIKYVSVGWTSDTDDTLTDSAWMGPPTYQASPTDTVALPGTVLGAWDEGFNRWVWALRVDDYGTGLDMTLLPYVSGATNFTVDWDEFGIPDFPTSGRSFASVDLVGYDGGSSGDGWLIGVIHYYDPDGSDVIRVTNFMPGGVRRLKRKPLRQFPRSDGLGMSSARRQDANRSMQASLRRGGGVYF